MADNSIHFSRPLADNSIVLSDSSCPVADKSETGQLEPDNSDRPTRELPASVKTGST